MGARLREVELKGIEDTARLVAEITVAEALSFHWDWIRKRPQDYGADVRERLKMNLDQPTVVYLHAQEKRRRVTRIFEEALDKVDVLVTPTLPVVPPLIAEKEIKIGRTTEPVRGVLLRFTRPGNLTGLPAISLPCGFTPDRIPIGMQIIARRFDEATLLRVADAYERATPWHNLFPAGKE